MNSFHLSPKSHRQSIAIIGTGIAGLSAYYFLKNNFDVTLFESEKALGMGKGGAFLDSQSFKIDIPLRIFNKSQYPFLSLLCEKSGIKARKIAHGGTIFSANDQPVFKYKNYFLGNRIFNLPKLDLFNLASNAMVLYHIKVLLYKYRKLSLEMELTKVSVRDFIAITKTDSFLINEIILPIFASICTCTYQQVLDYPAKTILECFYNFQTKQPFERFVGGTTTIENMLSNNGKDVLFDSKVIAVDFTIGENKSLPGVTITTPNKQYSYDRVIFATEANIAAKLTPDPAHKSLLERIPYVKSTSCVHSDSSIIGPKKDWSHVIYRRTKDNDLPITSMWLNEIEPELSNSKPLFQTLNPPEGIDPNKIIKSYTLSRPLQTPSSYQAVLDLLKLQSKDLQQNNISYVGSYLWPSLPLLETGVCSAWYLAKTLGSSNFEFDEIYKTHYQKSLI